MNYDDFGDDDYQYDDDPPLSGNEWIVILTVLTFMFACYFG